MDVPWGVCHNDSKLPCNAHKDFQCLKMLKFLLLLILKMDFMLMNSRLLILVYFVEKQIPLENMLLEKHFGGICRFQFANTVCLLGFCTLKQ